MNRLRLTRQFSARLLLAIFLPVLLLTDIHRHSGAACAQEVCEACVNHVSHSGHLSVSGFSLDSCLACQFVCLDYVAAAVITAAVLLTLLPTKPQRQAHFVAQRAQCCTQGRAPPVVTEQILRS